MEVSTRTGILDERVISGLHDVSEICLYELATGAKITFKYTDDIQQLINIISLTQEEYVILRKLFVTKSDVQKLRGMFKHDVSMAYEE